MVITVIRMTMGKVRQSGQRVTRGQCPPTLQDQGLTGPVRGKYLWMEYHKHWTGSPGPHRFQSCPTAWRLRSLQTMAPLWAAWSHL